MVCYFDFIVALICFSHWNYFKISWPESWEEREERELSDALVTTCSFGTYVMKEERLEDWFWLKRWDLMEKDKQTIGASLLQGQIWAADIIEAPHADRPALQPLWRSSSLFSFLRAACSSYGKPSAQFHCILPEENCKLGQGGVRHLYIIHSSATAARRQSWAVMLAYIIHVIGSFSILAKQ